MRVIAGTAKGVPLVAPRGPTRPTSDRVREAVFSALAGWAGAGGAPAASQLAGLSLLDLYAGSGAVAVEAASRGAGPVVAVDQAPAAVAAIRANAQAAQVAVEARRAPVESYLAGGGPGWGGSPGGEISGSGAPGGRAGGTGFDIVWLDPPYDLPGPVLEAVLAVLARSTWLAGRGLVALERSARSPAPAWPARLAQGWSKRYGETVVYYAQADREDAP